MILLSATGGRSVVVFGIVKIILNVPPYDIIKYFKYMCEKRVFHVISTIPFRANKWLSSHPAVSELIHISFENFLYRHANGTVALQ